MSMENYPVSLRSLMAYPQMPSSAYPSYPSTPYTNTNPYTTNTNHNNNNNNTYTMPYAHGFRFGSAITSNSYQSPLPTPAHCTPAQCTPDHSTPAHSMPGTASPTFALPESGFTSSPCASLSPSLRPHIGTQGQTAAQAQTETQTETQTAEQAQAQAQTQAQTQIPTPSTSHPLSLSQSYSQPYGQSYSQSGHHHPLSQSKPYGLMPSPSSAPMSSPNLLASMDSADDSLGYYHHHYAYRPEPPSSSSSSSLSLGKTLLLSDADLSMMSPASPTPPCASVHEDAVDLAQGLPVPTALSLGPQSIPAGMKSIMQANQQNFGQNQQLQPCPPQQQQQQQQQGHDSQSAMGWNPNFQLASSNFPTDPYPADPYPCLSPNFRDFIDNVPPSLLSRTEVTISTDDVPLRLSSATRSLSRGSHDMGPTSAPLLAAYRYPMTGSPMTGGAAPTTLLPTEASLSPEPGQSLASVADHVPQRRQSDPTAGRTRSRSTRTLPAHDVAIFRYLLSVRADGRDPYDGELVCAPQAPSSAAVGGGGGSEADASRRHFLEELMRARIDMAHVRGSSMWSTITNDARFAGHATASLQMKLKRKKAEFLANHPDLDRLCAKIVDRYNADHPEAPIHLPTFRESARDISRQYRGEQRQNRRYSQKMNRLTMA